jgi:hypothetical protein
MTCTAVIKWFAVAQGPIRTSANTAYLMPAIEITEAISSVCVIPVDMMTIMMAHVVMDMAAVMVMADMVVDMVMVVGTTGGRNNVLDNVQMC